MLKNEAYLFGLMIAIISSAFLFISLYNKASDPNLAAFWKGGNGYVSDEVWYVNSARNLLRDFYGIKTQFIDPKGYAYYTVVFTDFKSRDNQINIIQSKISEVNGKINKTYTNFPAICFMVPYNSNFEIPLENVTMFFSGFPYADVQSILNYYNFEHPPLGKLIIGASMIINRDEPIAWRIPSIIFSSLIPLIVFFIVTRLTDPIAGAVASIVPHLDTLMNNMGFIAFLDVYLAFFIALSLLFAVYNKYFISAIMIGIAAAIKLPAVFLIPALYVFLRIKGIDVFKSFYVSFIIPTITWFLINGFIIFKLGFLRWLNEIIGALKWHTTPRPPGPPTSTPWGWFINENPFYFHFNPTYSASVNIILYLAAIVFLIFTAYLTIYRSKDFAAPSLWFLGIFLGFILIYILGNRTLYSFYTFSFIPMVYVIFVANIYSMFFPIKNERKQ
jgi:predicted membrane-bound dolichyl-phosphate-mannose-protein mannosyltransferase